MFPRDPDRPPVGWCRMNAITRPGTPVGASTRGEVCPRPTRREVEEMLLKAFPGLSRSASNRAAKRSMAAANPYAAAVAEIRQRLLKGEIDETTLTLYADPTGNRAARRLDGRRAA